MECFAGQPTASVTHTLVLTQDSNEVWFQEIGWEFAVAPGAAPDAIFASSPSARDQHIRVPLSPDVPSAYMLQDSHYHFAHDTNHFSVAATGRDGRSHTRMEGEECGSWAALVGRSAGLQVFCRDAVRQHPKEFEVFGDRIVLKLFSNRAGEQLDFRSAALVKKWDLEGWCPHSTRPVRRDPAVIKAFLEEVLNYKSNAVGWAKTHQLMISPLAADNAVQEASRLGHLHQHPVYALADPWWIYASKAMGSLYPRIRSVFRRSRRRKRPPSSTGWTATASGARTASWITAPGRTLAVRSPDEQHFYPATFRYAYCTYSLRGNLRRLYARSGTRAVRDFAAGSIGAHMDNLHMHWEPPLVPGWCGASSAALRARLRSPLLLGRRPQPGNPVLHQFQQLPSLLPPDRLPARQGVPSSSMQTASRRSGPPTRRRCAPAASSCSTACCCRATASPGPGPRDLAEATADVFEDPEGSLLLTKNRSYRSTSYKTKVDVVRLDRRLADAGDAPLPPAGPHPGRAPLEKLLRFRRHWGLQ